ncbi:xanthine dehydrogenase family protein molybdopterin-binding subunit [Flavihumibacter petaseus]|uniref:Putative isoquinoline 1-oxidoreductase beta subunit n=1 Tax=Flavihumibacter petaseus NBRC 106054 TaxID=1220578 RepID=A0A0E9MUB6_9BACT|nr:molybdopterin cofactor-binding domain-containing protein [Flavihumibacter petaseus]GAO41006.1 putative isoquinoline 1-oxidoreductase beta subunit [Flavihumibacter petaseus NBRC 106054]
MTTITRRSFLKNAGGAGVALWLGLYVHGEVGKTTSPVTAAHFTPWILIESGGKITIYNTKPEIGQGTFQAIPALIAEELEVSLDQVTILNSNGEKELGTAQRAGGSASVRTSFSDLRKVGASAKEVLIQAAASTWGVDAATCYAENATVYHRASGKSIAYGDLVETAAKIELPKTPVLKDGKDFKIIGKSMRRPDVPLKTNGSAVFGIDVKVDGMRYASVERCPVIGGTLKQFDASAALKIKGVVTVVPVERVYGIHRNTGVAVIADNYWAALQGRKKLRVEWDTKGFEHFQSDEYEAGLRLMVSQEGLTDKNKGDIDALTIAPENLVEAFYETPMVAHHPMEPLNCIAQVKDDQVELWTSTQVPSNVTGSGPNDLHKLIGVAPENIKLHATFVGGGFGRRLYLDFIVEAVNIAKQVNYPVKVIWTREDTTEQGPFRPMTFSQLQGGFSAEGKLVTFRHKVISPSYAESVGRNFDPNKVDGTMVEGIAEQAYEIPNIRTAYVRAGYHVPVAAWRSVTSSTVAFAQECFLDELAWKAGMDPMSFRLSLLSAPSDTKRVLLTLKEVSGWDRPLPKGSGRGVATWEFFAGLCGQTVEVTHLSDGRIRIDKVVAVIDLGEVVNPDNVRNQTEGAIIMALGAAVKPDIRLKHGKVTHHNFYDNLLPRISETPLIDVHILAEGGKVKGVGEPGLPPFAPALANAIFAATGKRNRKMPFDLHV